MKVVVRSFRYLCAAACLSGPRYGLSVVSEGQTSSKNTKKSTTPKASTSRTSLARSATAARARRAAAARRVREAQLARGRDTPVQDGRARQSRARRPRGGRHHLQPGDGRRPLRGELARPTVDREPDEDHDGRDVRGRRSGSRSARRRHSRRHLPRLGDPHPHRGSHHLPRPSAPDAHCLGQCCGARARTDLGRRHRGVHRAHEPDGLESRAEELAVCGSVRPRFPQRVVGLRSVAPDCLRDLRRAARTDHAHARVRRAARTGARSQFATRTSCSAPTSTSSRGRPDSSQRPATAWRP